MNVVAVLNNGSLTTELFFREQGWQVARNQMPGQGQLPVMVRPHFDAAQLEACLKAPWVGGIEMDGGEGPPLGGTLGRHLAGGGLGLVLRSDTAYQTEVAPLFTAALRDRLLASDADTSDLEFVLHEMLSNALLHGNFGIQDGMPGDGDHGFERFEASLETAFATPEVLRRRVQISALLSEGRLELAVEDDGAGFSHAAVPADEERPHGLELVAGMAEDFRLEENGRRAVAVFPFRPRQRPKALVSLSGAYVLIVDDTRQNRDLLAALLMMIGVGRIEQAADGVEGLEILRREKPDLVLLDVMMPKMDGYEMCRGLRQLYPLSDLPVIFITALDGPSDRFACFAAGGTDVVSKPFNNSEVIARVGVHLQLGLIMDKLKHYQERVHDELQSARAAQLALAPTPEQISQASRRTGLEITGLMETSSELGGDFWTLIDAGPRQVCLLMADFTGHGTASAFNVFRLHLLLSRLPRQVPSPAALLDHLNAELRTVLKPGEFASVFAGLIDLDNNSLTFASGAAPSPVLVAAGKPCCLESEGPPLGAFDDPGYEEWTVPFPPGTRLLVYSDALVESQQDGKAVCDEATLLGWVAEADGEPALAEEILRRFQALLPGDPPDDLTLVCIQRAGL